MGDVVEAEMRCITVDEWSAFRHHRARVFALDPSPELDAIELGAFDLSRIYAIFDDDQICATAGVLARDVTVPGSKFIEAGAVHDVAVLPTHCRQGYLTKLMNYIHEDAGLRGELATVLTASESSIYGRYGYGPATLGWVAAIDTTSSAYHERVELTGRCRVIDDLAVAEKLLPSVHDAYRLSVPGEVNRPTEWWPAMTLCDHPDKRAGYSELQVVVHENGRGEVDGYVLYRRKREWEDGLSAGKVQVEELTSTCDAARVSLWRHVLDLDLTVEMTAHGVPMDEPLRWWLADPRRLRTKLLRDGLWVRLIDIPAALESRRYERDGELTLAIRCCRGAQMCGLRMTVSEGEAAVEVDSDVTEETADIALERRALGAAYLGGVSFVDLWRGGLVSARSQDAIELAASMFRTGRAPNLTTWF